MPYYRYPRPALTVDAVVFGLAEGGGPGAAAPGLDTLLVRRGNEPFRGQWALPGGFLQVGEAPEAAVRRELEEETGVKDIYLEQLATFGDPGRDPRGHTVTVAYYALARRGGHRASGGDDAAEARWFPAARPPRLAFDHADILRAALERLRAKVRYRPVGFELLPEAFPLGALQALYEAILGRPLDRRNFRRKALSLGILRDTGETERAGAGARRPARLYGFDRWAYQRMAKKGWDFTL